MPSKKEAALQYAALGWRVFPCAWMLLKGCSCERPDCHSPGKHPRIKGWPTAATTDRIAIAAWWDTWPEANIGIATGEGSNIWVLDLDGAEGIAALAEMEERRGQLPKTVRSRTGSGGQHIFFHWDAEHPVNSRTKLSGKKIDTRGTGGYVIVPPSCHKSGNNYEWVHAPGESVILPAPDWLLDFVRCNERPSRPTTFVSIPEREGFGEVAGEDDIRTAPGVSEGGRHSRACQLIGSALGRSFTLPRLTAFALDWARRCNPPWEDEEELLRIIEDLSHKDGEKFDDLEICDSEPWPVPRPEVFHGLSGEIVHTIEPETESDLMALQLQLLVCFGATIGRTAHCLVESTRHFGNLFIVVVGDTALARKGTSLDRIRALFRSDFGAFKPARFTQGLSSGEGLAWEVRDPVPKDSLPKAKLLQGQLNSTDTQGVSDKRLIVAESEFATVLAAMKRDTNTLSGVLRGAWESGNLDTMTKNSRATATNAHIAIIGHITVHELRSKWPTVENFNGFANRFLWVLARRSKLLPDGGRPLDMTSLQQRLAQSIEFANKIGVMVRDQEAAKLWHERYATLGGGRVGALENIISRAQPQVMRLSMLYALLDQSEVIRRVHLEAALAVWDYCEASAVHVFGQALGDQHAQRILTALGKGPMTTRELHKLFSNRLRGNDLQASLQMLLSQRRIRQERQDTGGRPSNTWFLA